MATSFIDAINELVKTAVNEVGDTAAGEYIYGKLDDTYRTWNPTEEMKQEVRERRGLTPEAKAMKDWAFQDVPQINVFDRTPEQQARIDAWKYETRKPVNNVGNHWLANILGGSWFRDSTTPEIRWANHPGNPDNPNNTRELAGLADGQTIDDVTATGQAIQQSLETGVLVSPSSVAPMSQSFRDELIRMSGQQPTGMSPLTQRQMGQIFGDTRGTANRTRGNDIPLAERYNTLFGRTPGTLNTGTSRTPTTRTADTATEATSQPVDTTDMESVLDYISPVLDVWMDKGFLGPGLAEQLTTPESRRAFYRTIMESEGFDMEGLLNRFNINDPAIGTAPTTTAETGSPTRGAWLNNAQPGQFDAAANDPYTAARFVLLNEGIPEQSIIYDQMIRYAPQIDAMFRLKGSGEPGSYRTDNKDYLNEYVQHLIMLESGREGWEAYRASIADVTRQNIRALGDPTTAIYEQLVQYEGTSPNGKYPSDYYRPGAGRYNTASDLYWGELFLPALTLYSVPTTQKNIWKASLDKLYQDYEVDKYFMEEPVPFALYMLENYRLVQDILNSGAGG